MKALLLATLLLFLPCCQRDTSLSSLQKQCQQTEKELLLELTSISSPLDFEAHEAKTSELFEDIAEALILANSLSREANQASSVAHNTTLSDQHQCLSR